MAMSAAKASPLAGGGAGAAEVEVDEAAAEEKEEELRVRVKELRLEMTDEEISEAVSMMPSDSEGIADDMCASFLHILAH